MPQPSCGLPEFSDIFCYGSVPLSSGSDLSLYSLNLGGVAELDSELSQKHIQITQLRSSLIMEDNHPFFCFSLEVRHNNINTGLVIRIHLAKPVQV